MMEEDFESWEAHVELHDRCDYPGLVRLCEGEVRRDPEDLHAVERLGHAYILNGDCTKAIQVMERYHRAAPEIDAFQWIILDALFADGKTEIDFDWSIKPEVLRIGPQVAELCYDYLRPKRKPRSVATLHCELSFSAYLTFTDQQLLQLLGQDVRFAVQGSDPWEAQVHVRRSERKTKRSTE